MKLNLLLLTLTLVLDMQPSSANSVGLCSKLGAGVIQSSNDPRMYFILVRKFRGGKLRHITEELAVFRRMGVKTLWLSPIHPQSHKVFVNNSVNDHGYWVKNHGEVDPELGGEVELARLIGEAKKRGIAIVIDTVPNHFGYLENVTVDGEILSTKDPRYFKQDTPGNDDRMNAIEQQIRDGVDQLPSDQILELHRKYSEGRLAGLPGIRHSEPKMRDYLVNSYKKFIDMGADGLRIDAAKHFDQDFLVYFISALQKYAASKGQKLNIYIEWLATKSGYLDVFVKNVLSKVDSPKNVFFLDFPLAEEVRRVGHDHFHLRYLKYFLEWRWSKKMSVQNLIPFVENHDFEAPLEDPYVRLLSYMLAQFFGNSSPIIHHGMETSRPSSYESRSQLDAVDVGGDISALRNVLGDSLEPYSVPNLQGAYTFYGEYTDQLIVERKVSPTKSVIIAVNRSHSRFGTRFQMEKLGAGGPTNLSVAYRHSAGGNKVTQFKTGKNLDDHSSLSIDLAPRSITILEREL